MYRVVGAISIAMALLLGGCAVFDKELNNRGGYADYLADQYWMRADSKQLRVLRGYALQAAVGRVAAISPFNSKDRDIIAVRMARANEGFERAYECAFVEYRPYGCIYFDDAMVDWTNGILKLATSSLSLEDGRTFATRIASGGVDTLEALFELGKDAFVLGRSIGALYRDTIELETVVWIEDTSLGDRTANLKKVYANGAGNLAEWKAELERLKADGGTLPMPQLKHFKQIHDVIVRSCIDITSDKKLQETCTGPDVTATTLVSVATQ